MNTHLPLPERSMPPEVAERIRAAILFEEVDGRKRGANRWMLGLAAALVVVALLATAALLWPATPETEVVERPSISPTPASTEPTSISTEVPSPTPRPSRTVPLKPGPKQKPFQTDRGALTNRKARAVIKECNAPTEGMKPWEPDIQEVLYARRATDGREPLDVVIYRRTDGAEWFCAPASSYVPLDEFDREVGPNASFPVVTDSGQGSGLDQDGATSEWIFRALSSVQRIQVRAVVDDKPRRWFEAEVHGGFAYLRLFTPGKFTWDDDARGPANVLYEQRAFDKDGREVPVRVMELPR